MKFKQLLIGICCVVGFVACAGNKNNAKNEAMEGSTVDSNYRVAVFFGSMCCGTASDEFLVNFFRNYKASASSKISADIAEGCGKEGEFFVLFNIAEKDTAAFISKLTPIIAAEEALNRKKDASSGTIELRLAVPKTDLEYCRMGVRPWTP